MHNPPKKRKKTKAHIARSQVHKNKAASIKTYMLYGPYFNHFFEGASLVDGKFNMKTRGGWSKKEIETNESTTQTITLALKVHFN